MPAVELVGRHQKHREHPHDSRPRQSSVSCTPGALPFTSSERNLNLYARGLPVFNCDRSTEQRQYAASYRGAQAKISACGDCIADREEIEEPGDGVGRYRAADTLDNNDEDLAGRPTEQAHRLPIG